MLSSELNHSILESAPDAMVIVDGAGIVLFANRQVSAIFGYEPGEVIGQPVENLLPERFRDRHFAHRDSYGARMRVRPMGSGLDLFARRRDGTEFPVEISLSPISDGDRTLVAAAIRDVTDRKRVEAELLAARESADRANQAKSRFLATASHDLRQPLQTLAMLNGALRRMVSERAVIDALEHQGQAIGVMSRLLNSLLDISKLESGAIKPEITDFTVAALFDELRREFASVAASKGIELRVELARTACTATRPWSARSSRTWSRNAIKYTREGWVQLRCLHEPRSGAHRGSRHRHRHPARPGRPHLRRVLPGGRIAQHHARRLRPRAEHRRPSGAPARRDGSTCNRKSAKARALLSRCRPAPRPPHVAAGAGARESGRARASAQVLLVEDDADVRDATRMLLRVEGYQVIAAGSLAEAISKARTLDSPPDVIVTDYHLGSGETGVQVIAALREVAGANVNAVVITGDTSSAMKELGRDNRLRIVSKPIDPEEFLGIVGQLAGRT